MLYCVVMTRNALPLSDVLPAVGESSEFHAIPADDILFRPKTIGRIAGWGCFDPNVTFELYDTTDGFTDHYFEPYDFPATRDPDILEELVFGGLTHARPPLYIGVNLAAMQEHLIETERDVQDPIVWSRFMDAHIAVELRQAVKNHLLDSPATRGEILTWVTGSAALEIGFSWTDAVLKLFDADTSRAGFWAVSLGIPIGAALLGNAAKLAWHLKYDRPLREACFSLFPGPHFDRLAPAYGVSKRRLVVPPPKMRR